MLILLSLLIFSCSDDSTSSDTEPPNPPSNPNPANNATSVSTNANLSWECSDPDGDPLTYDVYFGTSASPPLVNSGQSSTTYDPGNLNEETTYYWKIEAHDDHGNSTMGAVWQFTTTSGVTGTVIDIDGNVYQTIVIGDHEWIMENLRVTHYRNGDPIPTGYSNSQWSTLSTGAYCVYYDAPSNAETYGNLYNWFAVDDPRGIAPEGWHIPTDEEWTTLVNYLGGSSVAGGQLKEAGFEHWNPPNTGATNERCFTALPGGCRGGDGYYYNLGLCGCFWSSTEYDTGGAWYRWLSYDSSEVYRDHSDKRCGSSVRCIRD